MRPALLIALLIVASLGCTSARLPSSVAVEDPGLERAWRESVFVAPGETRSQQRALFRRGGSELDFTLLFQASRPDELRIVGLTDLGGTLFHVERRAGAMRVIQGTPFLEDRFLAGALAGGIELVLRGVPPGSLRLVRLDSGQLALHGFAGAREVLLTGASAPGPPDVFLLGEDGELLARVTVEEWRRGSDGKILCPERFTLVDGDGRAFLRSRTIEWKAAGSP